MIRREIAPRTIALVALVLPALAAAQTGAKPVGPGVQYTCQTTAPSPAATERTWVRCSDHHLLQTNALGATSDISAGSGGGGSGTVTDVDTGLGLQGGPITTSGTVDLRLSGVGGLTKTLGVGSNELGVAAGGVTNSMLASPSLTIGTTAPVTGGGNVSLGGTLTLACGSCLTGTPTAAGDLMYSTSGGQAMSRLAVGTSSQILVGGSAPSWGTLPSGAMPNVGPGAGTYALSTGDSVTLDAQGRTTAVGSVTRTLIGGSGINAIGNLSADRTISVDQSFSPTWTGAHTFAGYTDWNPSIATPATPVAGIRWYSKNRNGVERPTYVASDGVETVLSRDQLFVVRNTTGSTLTRGTVVYVTGSTGGIPTVAPAQADAGMTKLPAIGIIAADIANNSFGRAYTTGLLGSYNTSSFSAGDTLYVSPTTPGALTNVLPTHPSVEQAVGVVSSSGVGSGAIEIFITPLNTHHIDGVNGSTFAVGDGTGTTKSYVVKNAAGTGTLSWNPSASRTLTLPDATDTIVGRATGDTLTNKTISGASNTLSNIGNVSLVNSTITENLPSAVFSGSGSVSLGGTQTFSLQTQAANTVWAGPTTGAAATPTFRALVAADIPSLSGTYLPLAGGTMSGPIVLSGTQTGTYTLGGTYTIGGAPTLGASLAVDATASNRAIGDATHLLAGVAATHLLGGSSNTSGHVVPNVADDTIALLAATQTLTNKTISGANNTLSNIGNGSLTNSSITINTTSPVGGGAAVSLGGSITLTCGSCLTGTPTTIGDLMYSTSGGQAMSRLADVAAGSYLRSGGAAAAPVWSTLTLPNAATTGDLLIATGTNAVGSLADVATTNVLLSGGVGAAPSWGKVANAALSNSSITLSTTSPIGGGATVALGGTATLTCSSCITGTPTATGDLLYSTSGGQATSPLADVAVGSVLISGGVGAAPSWGTVPSAALPNVGPGAGTIGASPNAIQSITLDAQGRVTAAATVANVATGTFTSGRLTVGTGTNTIGDSTLTYSAGALDVTSGGLTFCASVATGCQLGRAGINLSSMSNTLVFSTTGAANKSILVQTQSVVDTAGNDLTLNSGIGGAASAVAGGKGGTLKLISQIGGAGTASLAPGAGGDFQLFAGAAAAGGTGNANGGNGTIRAGAKSGTGTAGTLTIGDLNTSAIGLGASGITTTVTGGLTQLTGAVSLAGNAASSITTSSGALTLTSAAAATWDSADGTVKVATLDRSTAGTLTLGGTATTIQLAAGVSLSGAAGAGGLSLGSMTGNATLPTGSVSWSGASGKTLALTSTAATLSITAGAASTWDSANGTVKAATLDRSTAGTLTIAGTASAITLAASTTISDAKTLTATYNGIGTAQTVHTSWQNTTAAALGAQQASPVAELVGQGWNPTSSSSKAVKWGLQVLPVQASSGDPTGNISFYSSFAGASYLERIRFTDLTSAAGIVIGASSGNAVSILSGYAAAQVNSVPYATAQAWFPDRDAVAGYSLGSPTLRNYDQFSIRSSQSTLGLGDVAPLPWAAPYITNAGYTTLSTSQPYGLLNVGGQTRLAAAANVGTVTVTPTGGSATSYTYLVVGVDRAGNTTLAATGTTSTGAATLSAAAFNTLSWSAVPGIAYYDVYLTSVGVNQWLASTSLTTFKDTIGTSNSNGRYTTPGAGAVFSVVSAGVTATGGSGTASTYYIYAADADGHLSAVTSVSSLPTPTTANPVTLNWTPVGGASYYAIGRGQSTSIIGTTALQPQGNGTTTVAVTVLTGGLVRTGGSTVTATIAKGHGLRVSDSFTLTSADANFPSGTYTVATVTSSTVFTYASSGSNTTSAAVSITYTGPTVAGASFVDFLYPARTVGTATRNTTGDVIADGQLQVNGQTAGAAAIFKGTAVTTTNSPPSLTTWVDSSGTARAGVDAMGMQTLGSEFEFREHWCWTTTVGTGNPITNSNGVWNYSNTNGGGAGSGFAVTSGVAFTCSLAISTGTALNAVGNVTGPGLNAAAFTNLYAVHEWYASISSVGANTVTYSMGVTNGTLVSAAHPAGWYFSKATGDTNWQCNTDDGTNTSGPTNTNVAPTASVFQSFRIEFYGSGTPVGVANSNAPVAKFYINGALVCTKTANVYAASSVFVQFATKVTTGLGAAQTMKIGPVLQKYHNISSTFAP